MGGVSGGDRGHRGGASERARGTDRVNCRQALEWHIGYEAMAPCMGRCRTSQLESLSRIQ